MTVAWENHSLTSGVPAAGRGLHWGQWGSCPRRLCTPCCSSPKLRRRLCSGGLRAPALLRLESWWARQGPGDIYLRLLYRKQCFSQSPVGKSGHTEQAISVRFPRGSLQVLPLWSKDSKQDVKQMNRTQNALKKKRGGTFCFLWSERINDICHMVCLEPDQLSGLFNLYLSTSFKNSF